MLGHRGCRLLISHPEIAEMQARAIFEAAIEAGKRTGNQRRQMAGPLAKALDQTVLDDGQEIAIHRFQHQGIDIRVRVYRCRCAFGASDDRQRNLPNPLVELRQRGFHVLHFI